MLEPAGASGAGLRAGLGIVGISLAGHQLAACVAMKIERIICLARRMDPEVLALQHEAEALGMKFSVANRSQDIMTAVMANDDLLVLAEGLYADPQAICELLKEGHCILVQPAASGTSAGFERVDFTHATAGAMRIPGQLVAELGRLSDDCDVVSSLNRIALQAGILRAELPASLIDSGRWALVRDEAEALEMERQWLDRLTGTLRGQGPGQSLAGMLARWLGPVLLNGGGNGLLILAPALFFPALALVAGNFRFPALALTMVLCGWMALRVLSLLHDLTGAVPGKGSMSRYRLMSARSSLTDGMADLVLVLVMMQTSPATLTLGDAMFVPLAMIGILRISGFSGCQGWRGWLGDRFVILLLLVAAAMAGWLRPMAMTWAIVLLVANLFQSHRQTGRLTTD